MLFTAATTSFVIHAAGEWLSSRRVSVGASKRGHLGDLPKLGSLDWNHDVVEFSVVIWAETQNVARIYATIVRVAERTDLMSLGVIGTVWKSDSLATDLTSPQPKTPK